MFTMILRTIDYDEYQIKYLDRVSQDGLSSSRTKGVGC